MDSRLGSHVRNGLFLLFAILFTMKKRSVHPVLKFLSLLPVPSAGQQFLAVVFLLVFVFFFSRYYLSSYFHKEVRTTSTASYEGLDPRSYGYWRERTERDIASAQVSAKPSLPRNELLASNISATIQAASQLGDPSEKALAISSIIRAQIDQNVGTNIDEALLALGTHPAVRTLRMNLAASLAFFYLPADQHKAVSAVQNYLALLRETSFNPEVAEQKHSLVQILDACVVLNLYRELDATLRYLLSTANSIVNENRKNPLLGFIAEQQIRFQKYSDALTTLSRVTQPDLLAQCYQKLIESRAQVIPVPAEKTTPERLPTVLQSEIRNPDLVSQMLERVLKNIGQIRDQQDQQVVLRQLLESDMMLHTELHSLVRGVLIETESLSTSMKARALAFVDNPRSSSLRTARGLPLLTAGSQNRDEHLTDEQLLDRARQILAPQPLSKNRMYQEDIRVLTNTATELLNWGQKKEAVLLLRQAAERARGLSFDNRPGMSRPALAAILVGAGEIETARELLHEEYENLIFSRGTAQNEEEYRRIAEVQLRARLLEETFQTLQEMLPSRMKVNLLQSLVQEQVKIGLFEEAQRSVAEMPASSVKTAWHDSLVEAGRRLRKKVDENLYTYPPLEEILRSNQPDKHQRLFDLTVTLLQEGWLIDAREVARHISEPATRDRALDLIVQEAIVVFRSYFSEIPLHQQVRKHLSLFAFQTAKEISSPQNRLLAMERVYSQTARTQDADDSLPEWVEIREEMTVLWNSLSDTNDSAVKIDLGIRLFQTELRVHASEVQGRVGGNWHVLPENTSFPSDEQKRMLLKVAEWVSQLESADDRAVRSAQIAALFYQIRDPVNGKSLIEVAAGACETVTRKDIAANVSVSLAQILHEAGEPEESEKMFAQALSNAEQILFEGTDRLLNKRKKDRILTEISRAVAEIGRIPEAMQISKMIDEKFFVDRLCKAIGYLQINQGAYEEAEATFKNIRDGNRRNSCLNDALFRRRWEGLEM